jgi:hypothetical protein
LTAQKRTFGFKAFRSFFVLAKNEPKNRVGRVEELAIASAENSVEIFLKFQNSLCSDSWNFLTENIHGIFILRSPTGRSIGITS